MCVLTGPVCIVQAKAGACRWIEAGKFLTGFSAVGLVAVPAILAHAEYITFGAMMIEMCAAASIGLMVVVYDYSTTDAYY